MEKVRLSDIAERIGVSTVTIHNALSGNKGVGEELRKQIQEIADEMGYQPPAARRQVKEEQEFYTIGVLIAENYLAQYTTFYWKIYQEMAILATEKHCFTAVEVLKKEDEMKTYKMPASLEENRLDGLVVIGEIDKVYISHLQKNADIPLIFMDFYDSKLAEDAVVQDNFYGMFMLTEYMFEQGVDELAFVGSIFSTSSIMDRYCGFMKSMTLHGKNIHPEWLIEDRDEFGHMEFDLPQRLPKGFVCNCDLAASMVMDKLNERGIRVPEDISVVGFDNYLYPGLPDRNITTYEVNKKAMARAAIDKILKQIRNPKSGRGMSVISGNMVIKKTVRQKSE